MNPEPLIVLEGLEGNAHAGKLTSLQEALEPAAPTIASAYWVVWSVILCLVVVRWLVWPRLRTGTTAPKAHRP